MTMKPSRQSAALVTGAGSGIGRAFCLELGRRGGRILCADIHLQSAQDTVGLLSSQGVHAVAVQCDVADERQVAKLAADAETLLGCPLTLVINNAGVGGAGKVGEVPLEDWHPVINVNLWGVIHGCHYFLPILKRQGSGAILNVASAAGFGGVPNLAAYNVSKAGVIALSETLAAELAGQNIRVSVLCPTMVPTDIVKNTRKSGRLPEALSDKGDIAMSKFVFTTTEAVVTKALDRLDGGHLYTVPQLDAKLIWLAKRAMPTLYARGMGRLSRKYLG